HRRSAPAEGRDARRAGPTAQLPGGRRFRQSQVLVPRRNRQRSVGGAQRAQPDVSPVGLSRLAPLARVALGLSPWAPAPRPDRGAAVTAAWLTEVFARRAPGAAVERVDVVDATAGT